MSTKIILLLVGIAIIVLVTQVGMSPSSNLAESQKPEEAMTNGPTAASERAEKKAAVAARAAKKAAQAAVDAAKAGVEATQ